MEKVYRGFRVDFIMGVGNGKKEQVRENLRKTDFPHIVYLDEGQKLLSKNPQIPHESLYHTFLLDKDSHVALVGSPLYNESMEKLLLKVIEKECPKVGTIVQTSSPNIY